MMFKKRFKGHFKVSALKSKVINFEFWVLMKWWCPCHQINLTREQEFMTQTLLKCGFFLLINFVGSFLVLFSDLVSSHLITSCLVGSSCLVSLDHLISPRFIGLSCIVSSCLLSVTFDWCDSHTAAPFFSSFFWLSHSFCSWTKWFLVSCFPAGAQ